MTHAHNAAEELYGMFHLSHRNDGYEAAKHKEWMDKVVPVIENAINAANLDLTKWIDDESSKVAGLISEKITGDVRDAIRAACAERDRQAVEWVRGHELASDVDPNSEARFKVVKISRKLSAIEKHKKDVMADALAAYLAAL